MTRHQKRAVWAFILAVCGGPWAIGVGLVWMGVVCDSPPDVLHETLLLAGSAAPLALPIGLALAALRHDAAPTAPYRALSWLALGLSASLAMFFFVGYVNDLRHGSASVGACL